MSIEDIVREHDLGDCCEAAIKGLDYLVGRLGMSPDDLSVVHGLVTGAKGYVAGVRYGHAWIEHANGMVFDFSNGHDALVSRAMYYVAGGILDAETRRYSYSEARRESVRHGHYGPWSRMLLEHWVPDHMEVEA